MGENSQVFLSLNVVRRGEREGWWLFFSPEREWEIINNDWSIIIIKYTRLVLVCCSGNRKKCQNQFNSKTPEKNKIDIQPIISINTIISRVSWLVNMVFDANNNDNDDQGEEIHIHFINTMCDSRMFSDLFCYTHKLAYKKKVRQIHLDFPLFRKEKKNKK